MASHVYRRRWRHRAVSFYHCWITDKPLQESAGGRGSPNVKRYRRRQLERSGYAELCDYQFSLMAFSYTDLRQPPDFSSFPPDQFKSLARIYFTDTRLNNLRLVRMHLPKLTNLRVLNLSKNRLDHFPLSLVFRLPHLRELNLSSNRTLTLEVFEECLTVDQLQTGHPSLEVSDRGQTDIFFFFFASIYFTRMAK